MSKLSFNELITKSEKPVLVDFHADWCGPCQMLSPILKEIAAEHADKVKIIKIDVDRNPEIAAKYQIRGVPTMILFHQGQILWRQSGLPPKRMIEEQVMAHAQV